ncbi:MAG TPA: TIGR03435 family protein [Bryobacteraceae bacterium]|nr:TIGR03435 family protein [Bryobacteraceae bacterium]
MRRLPATVGLGVLLGAAAFPQSTFEVADVHVSAPDATPSTAFLPKRLEFIGVTLLHLITTAYGVRAEQVYGGPTWLDTDRFDVVADAGRTASAGEMRTMLQALLAERFGLVAQREDKPLPAYVLVLARQGWAKESSGSGDPDCQMKAEEGVRTIACHNMPMEELAKRLQINAAGYFNLPTVDRTGLKGAYDFSLSFVPRGQLPPGAEGNSMSLFTVIEKQLGVRVEKRDEPLPALTIARLSRTPSPNAPGVAEKLAPPAKFEVADIRPSRPGTNMDADIKNGRIDAHGLNLRLLISYAYNVEESWVKGGERFVDSEHFDLMAKTEPTESDDALRVMLQALLQDRFHLQVHKEPQPVTVYTLKAAKPRMKEADPSERSTCRGGLANGERTIACTNMTMAQFAGKLQTMNTGYLEQHRVVDLTDLKGAYDFTVSYTARAILEGGARTGGAKGEASSSSGSALPVPADRPVGLTLFEAIDKQLGLKLATGKHPMPIIVIDHVDRAPTEN